jgi:hypothetical protein
MTTVERGEKHNVMAATTECECHAADFKTTIIIKSGIGDSMMRRYYRRGEVPMTMMILDDDNETMLR